MVKSLIVRMNYNSLERIKSVFPMINSKETMVSYFNRLAKALESYGGNIK